MRRLPTAGAKSTSLGQRLTKTSSPLAAQYVVDIQVGTPSQPLTVGIDTQFSSLVLESSSCSCKANMFDDSKSSTFQDTGYRWSNDMDVDMGRIAYDNVNVSGLTVSEQEFAVADVPYWSREPENPHLSSDPFDGILGLGAGPTGSIAGETPFLKNVLDQLDAPVFALYMSHSGGQITFGGKDTRNCDASWTYVGLFDEDVWKVHLYG
ncbi:ASP-1 protein [Aphelenchoides avenae]|nr:ASP-1 protein [Aphelenchus avenae]